MKIIQFLFLFSFCIALSFSALHAQEFPPRESSEEPILTPDAEQPSSFINKTCMLKTYRNFCLRCADGSLQVTSVPTNRVSGRVLWELIPVTNVSNLGSGYYKIKNVRDGMYLTAGRHGLSLASEDAQKEEGDWGYGRQWWRLVNFDPFDLRKQGYCKIQSYKGFNLAISQGQIKLVPDNQVVMAQGSTEQERRRYLHQRKSEMAWKCEQYVGPMPIEAR